MGHREGDEQRPTASTSQVSFASQKGPMAAIMQIAVIVVAEQKERADTEIEAVQGHVDEDRDPHERGEGEGAPHARVAEEIHA